MVRAVNELIDKAMELQRERHSPRADARRADRAHARRRPHARRRRAARTFRRSALVSRIKIIAASTSPNAGCRRTAARGSRTARGEARHPRRDDADASTAKSAVIRLLPSDRGLLDVRELGMSDARRRTLIRQLLDQPHGLIIITGPTGSGKTTTLATMLSLLNAPFRKILTIEDPIEYELPGVAQSQVRPEIGLTFAAAMRAFLRQDPDVIMVGEVRDAETAGIAVHAALTGHLVLTTLHTDTAAAAAPRLIDLGVEPFLLKSTLRAVVGQRLVRAAVRALQDAARPQRSPISTRTRATRRSACAKARRAIRAEGLRPLLGGRLSRPRRRVRGARRRPRDARADRSARPRPATLETAARRAGMTTMMDDAIAKCRAGRHLGRRGVPRHDGALARCRSFHYRAVRSGRRRQRGQHLRRRRRRGGARLQSRGLALDRDASRGGGGRFLRRRLGVSVRAPKT